MNELLERFRDLAYETGWLAGKAEAGGEVDAEYQKGKIAERGQAANVILVRHEEECRAGARRSQAAILPCGHHASNAVIGEDGKARCEMCELQAQVAVMAEELDCIANVTEDGNSLTKKDVEAIRQIALSAAPKVAWQGKAIADHDDYSALREPHTVLRIVGHGAVAIKGEHFCEDGQQVEVLVIAKPEQPQESEQGYVRARGVIPWQEGDELPEDAIARIRGRGPESEQFSAAGEFSGCPEKGQESEQ